MLFGNTLVIVWDHSKGPSFIGALDKRTGKELWRTNRDEIDTWATPLVVPVDGRHQVIVPAMNKVPRYDLETGKEVWAAPGTTMNAIPSPVHANGVVYLMSGFRGNNLMAIRLPGAKGNLAGTAAIVWELDRDTPYVPSPLLYDGILYSLKTNNGLLSAFDAATGKPHYQLQRLDKAPNVFSSMKEWIPGKRQLNGVPFDYQYYIWRGPVSLKVERGRLVTEFPDVGYRLRVRMKDLNGGTRIAECGYGENANLRVKLEAVSEVQWNEDWVIHTNTRFGRPQFGEPCRLSPIDLDVTELLDEWFNQRLPSLASAIDQTFLTHVEAKRRAQIIWEKLQEPMELRPGTWLIYRPQNPGPGPLTLNRDQPVQTTISLAFDPMIVVGPKPPLESNPLPPLRIGPSAPEGFHLAVPMLVPYEELNKRLAEEIVGQEIIPPVGSRIKITGVQAYGSGNNLITEVTVTGGVNGKLYLQGKPTLTPDGQTLELRDFNFTMDTSNLLAKFANRTMYDAIPEKVLPNTKIEVGDRIAALRSRVQRHMNRKLAPDIWIEGAVASFDPCNIYPVPGGIELQFVMDGTLNLTIQ